MAAAAAATMLAASLAVAEDESKPAIESFSTESAPRLLGPLEASPLSTRPRASGNRDSDIGTVIIEDRSDPPATPRRAPARSLPTRSLPARMAGLPKAAAAGPVAADVGAADEVVTAEATSGNTSKSTLPVASQAAAALPLVEASRLKGIQPGTSTSAEVRMAWGMPIKVENHPDRIEHEYALPPFARVETVFSRDVVSVIVVYLAQPIPVIDARLQLALTDIDPAAVFNDRSELLGEVYPERGVLLSFAPGEQQHRVAQIILEPIHAQPFVLRGEARLATQPQASLRDVDQALAMDPKFTRALWLKAQLLAASGDISGALPLAEEAVRGEPDNIEYRLTRAKILDLDGQHSRAISETKAALVKSGIVPLVKARGLAQLADLVTAPPACDYALAVEHRQEAIKLLEPLVSEPNANLIAAQQWMLNLHLGVAHDIAWGNWNRKVAVVPKWLEEAESLASASSPTGVASTEQRFLISRKALAALAGAQGELDPTAWAKTAEQTGRQLLASATDPLRQRQIEQELGMAMFDALQIYHARNQPQPALRCGGVAAQCLEAVAASPIGSSDAYQLGRLYFRIGAVHAVLGSDHAAAISWFNKALPLLKEPAASGDLGRQGESLVSMAVSYWETGDKPRGMQLTKDGLRWMEQAAKQGLLADSALTVPYANLSTMHRHLGDVEAAGQFEQMAARSQGIQR
jgi:tetratricopeptide (TPR) repeat protein